MKLKIILTLLALLPSIALASPAAILNKHRANSGGGYNGHFIFVVPQKPGKGTSQWTNIVLKELRKTPAMRNKNLVINYYPGARDMTGPNKFHTHLRQQSHIVLVSHGGNGISYVQEKVKYDYTKYDSICHQNLNIIVAKRTGVKPDHGFSFASGSGMVPEGIAIALMIAGPNLSLDQYIHVFNSKVTWVNGVSGGRRLAFARGELLGTRENPAAYKSKVVPLIKEGFAETWFHHGVLDIATSKHVDDVNYPGFRFEEVFKKKWGAYPKGELYDAYKMIHSWRDSIQKALWVNKGNKNTKLLRTACKQMSENPESVAILEKKIGKYKWVIGEDGNKTIRILKSMTTQKALSALVKFNREALGLHSIFKPELLK